MKIKNKFILPILMVIIAATLILSGCSKKAPTTLEEYINSEDGGTEVLSGIVADDENVTIEFEGNTMKFVYVVEDDAITEEMLSNALDSLGDTFTGIIKDLETKTGIDGINVEVIYTDGEGNTITEKVFE